MSHLNLHLKLTDRCKDKLVEDGYDINYGARPLKRRVSREIETLLSHHIINGDIKNNDTLVVDYRDNEFKINRE